MIAWQVSAHWMEELVGPGCAGDGNAGYYGAAVVGTGYMDVGSTATQGMLSQGAAVRERRHARLQTGPQQQLE